MNYASLLSYWSSDDTEVVTMDEQTSRMGPLFTSQHIIKVQIEDSVCIMPPARFQVTCAPLTKGHTYFIGIQPGDRCTSA